MINHTQCQSSRARGAVLLEVMLAVALFVTAAAFALGASKSVFAGLARTARQLEAVDLARSKLAELEAGLITLADLRGTSARHVGSIETLNDLGSSGAGTRWLFNVKTSRTEFTDLSLVELTVREEQPSDAEDDSPALSVTLRQLMPLRDSDDEEFRQDPAAGESQEDPL